MTLVFCCSFACGVDGASGQHWSASGTTSIQTTTKRTGTRALRINPTGGTGFRQVNLSLSSTINVLRFYVRFATLPNSTTALCQMSSGTNRAGVFFYAPDGKIYAGSDANGTLTMGSSGVSVTTGNWYCIDLKIDSSANPWLIDAKVDGTSCGQRSFAVASAGLAGFLLGSGNIRTSDEFYDDVAWSQTSGDYPIGPGHVDVYSPVADGIHNIAGTGDFKHGTAGTDILNSTTDAWTMVDKEPFGSIDTANLIAAIAPPNTTDYVECVFGPGSGVGSPSAGPRGVEVFLMYHQAATQSGQMVVELNDNGTISTVFDTGAAAGVTSARFATKHYALAPSGVAWHVANDGSNGDLMDLRFRFRAPDAAPDQYLDAIMIEAEFADSSGTPYTQTLTGGVTPGGTLVKLTSKQVKGGTTPAGAVIKAILKPLTGGIAPVGVSYKQKGIIKAGSITPIGAPANVKGKTYTGSITPAGALVKNVAQVKAGNVTPGGILVKLTSKQVKGTVIPSGIVVKLAGKLVSGILLPAGAVVKATVKQVKGTITSTGLAVKLISIFKSSGITPTGFLSAGTPRLQTLVGTVTSTGSLVKLVAKRLSGGLTPSGALVKAMAKKLAGGVTPTGALLKSSLKTLVGSLTPTGTIKKAVSVFKSGLITTSGRLVGLGQNTLILSGTLHPTGVLVKAVNHFKSGNITPVGLLVKLVASTKTGLIASAGALIKAVSTKKTGAITPTGAISNLAVKPRTLTGAVTPHGSLVKVIGKSLSGTINFTGSVAKSIAKYLVGLLTPVGHLLAEKLGQFEAGELKTKVYYATKVDVEELTLLKVEVFEATEVDPLLEG